MGWLWRVGLLLLAGWGWALSPQLDQDQDGFPDVAELASKPEREAFLRWFAAVAEGLYTAPPTHWLPQDQDCSGLLRFAFVEALRPKTPEWFARFKYLPEVQIPPLKLAYPLPEIGRSVFRVSPGSFRWNDVMEGRLVGRTTAYYLMRYSTVLLGRDPAQARRGDLLFFAHPLADGSAYHSMVYLGDGRVVYHTGLAAGEGGEVRLLSLETLKKHPVRSWHPVASNPHFLGFFRWKIAY